MYQTKFKKKTLFFIWIISCKKCMFTTKKTNNFYSKILHYSHLSKLTETLNFLFSSPANCTFGSLLIFLSYAPPTLLLFALLLLALFWWIMLRLFCDGYGGRSGGTELCWLLCDDDLDLFASDSIGGNVQTSPLRWNPFWCERRRKKKKKAKMNRRWAKKGDKGN